MARARRPARNLARTRLWLEEKVTLPNGTVSVRKLPCDTVPRAAVVIIRRQTTPQALRRAGADDLLDAWKEQRYSGIVERNGGRLEWRILGNVGHNISRNNLKGRMWGNVHFGHSNGGDKGNKGGE